MLFHPQIVWLQRFFLQSSSYRAHDRGECFQDFPHGVRITAQGLRLLHNVMQGVLGIGELARALAPGTRLAHGSKEQAVGGGHSTLIHAFQGDLAHVLVCHRDGQRVLSYMTAWHNACRRAGVTMRPYDIRHLAATAMLSAGADLAAVAAQLGHASVATTGATYAHVTAGAQARVASLMPEIGNGDTGDRVVIQKTTKKRSR